MCEKCADADMNLDADGPCPAVEEDRNRGRSKSPLVNSAERPGKIHKVDIFTPLAECPIFPVPLTTSSSSQNDVPPPPPPPNQSGDILAAIKALGEQMQNLSMKTESIEKKLDGMASKADLADFKKDILKETKEHVSEFLEPITKDVKEMKNRIGILETRPVSSSTVKNETIVHLQNNWINSILPKSALVLWGGPTLFQLKTVWKLSQNI